MKFDINITLSRKEDVQVLLELRRISNALTNLEIQMARTFDEVKSDLAVLTVLAVDTDKKLDDLIAAGTGATPEQLQELSDSIKGAVTQMNASNPPAVP